MSKQAFDKKLEAIQALRSEPASEAAIEQLRKALRDRSNYLVSKAAAIAADRSFSGLIPDLLAAFDRFLIDAVKSDPKCWAKNAIVKALKDLGHRDPQVYLKGIAHVQPEPSWGEPVDSAVTLRGACALALVDCRLDDIEILRYLVDGLADKELPVRTDTVIAIGQLGRIEGALLLRLKCLLGDKEPEVIGRCFSTLLDLTRREAVPFVEKFLGAGEQDIAIEAAAALAQSREPEAIDLLKTFWQTLLSSELRSALIAALGASPLSEAAGLLLAILSEGTGEIAAAALEALATSRFRVEMRDRIAAALAAKGNNKLSRLFKEKFPA